MKAKIWIRIAAILMFLHTIGHSFGTFGKGIRDKKIIEVTEAMAQNHFVFMGRSASLAIFFKGYAVSIIFFLLLVSLLLWFIADSGETPLGRKLLILSMLFLVVFTVIEIIYCFPFYLTPLAAICTIIAFFKINKTNSITT